MFEGQGYGVAKAQADAQRQVPAGLPSPAAGPAASAPARPISVTPLNAPTERPDEPVTAGASFGPGPGPEALAPPPQIHPGAKLLTWLAAQPTATPEVQRLAYSVGRAAYTPAPNPDDLFDALGG